MSQIETALQTSSDTFTENKRHMMELVEHIRGLRKKVEAGGGPEAIEKHKSRSKLTARERIR